LRNYRCSADIRSALRASLKAVCGTLRGKNFNVRPSLRLVRPLRFSRAALYVMHGGNDKGQRINCVYNRILIMTKNSLFLILFFSSLLFYGCGGTCSLNLRVINYSGNDQRIEISSNKVVLSDFILPSLNDSILIFKQYIPTEIYLPGMTPDSEYVAYDVDHWYSTVHSGALKIHPKKITFDGALYFHTEKRNK
jgi:hypothetical protein